MLKVSISFFILGLLSFLLGVSGAMNFSMQVGKNLLIVFLVFSLISFIAGITTGKSKDKMS